MGRDRGNRVTPVHNCSCSSASTNQNETLKVGPREISAIIPRFDPDDPCCISAELWIRDCNAARSMYEWGDRMAILYCSMRLYGTALVWYHAAKSQFLTWEMFEKDFIDNFPITVDIPAIHEKLRKAQRSRHETTMAYYHRMVAMGRKINLDDKSMQEYIIGGISPESRRVTLRNRKYATLSELLKALQDTEESQKSQEDRKDHRTGKGGRSSRHSGRYHPYSSGSQRKDKRYKDCDNESKKESSGKREKSADDGDWKKRKTCHYCKEPGHFIASCPKKPGDFRVRVVELPTLPNKKELMKKSVIMQQNVETFIDYGSDCTLIQHTVANRLGLKWKNGGSYLTGYGGARHKTLGSVTAKIKLDQVEREILLHVVPDQLQKCEMLLGRDFFHDPHVVSLRTWNNLIITDTSRENQVMEVDFSGENEGTLEEISDNLISVGVSVSEITKERLKGLIRENRRCFSLNTAELGHTDIEEMVIQTTTDKVIKYAPYRVPYALRKEVRNKIDELLRFHIIEPSTSEYASPMIVLRKKNGDLRLCVDYRRINAIVKKEYFPMPNIEEKLNDLSGKKLFSCLDLYMGYHQIGVAEESRKYTAFVTTEGLYQYCRVPFGLANSPAIFMRVISRALEPLDKKDVTCFMDDILIATVDEESHLKVLADLFSQLKKHHLTLNLAKCQFLQTSISYLGHEITEEGVSPGNLKTRAISEFQCPTTVKEVKRFLGLTGYFRRFVPNYAHIAAPLNQLKGQETEPLVLTDDQLKAFETLKQKLCEHPVLTLYNPEKRHELHCDASKFGLGGILLQADDSGHLKPVSFFSRKTTKLEQKYHSYEWETLAVKESLLRFRYYLLGKTFKIVTDCKALQQSKDTQHLVPRVARWWLCIMEFDFIMEHRRESKMRHVDCLSRTPYEEPEDEEHQEIMIVQMEEDWVVALQLKDPEISRIRQILDGNLKEEADEKNVRKNFQLVNGRVFAKTAKGFRFYVPKGVRFHVMLSGHYGMGHPGAKRTLEYLQREYWFPKMREAVEKFVSFCIPCAVHKSGKDENNHQIYVMKKTPVPFHTVHVDFCGPFPKTGGRKEYVFAIVDAFTRFVTLRAVAAPTTKIAIKVLEEINQYFGTPSVVVSDNGTAFTSKEFRKYCEDNVIKHALISVATPRANGIVERIFRGVKDSLKTLSQDHEGRDWDKRLHKVQWSLNTLTNRTTGESPQRMLLGFSPKNTLGDQLYNSLIVDHEEVSSVQDIRKKAHERMSSLQERQAVKYNSNHTAPTIYNEGDLVLVRHNIPAFGSSRKMTARYRGPYLVNKVLGSDRYIITDTPITQVTQKRFSGTYPAERLKKWVTEEELRRINGLWDEEFEISD